ncbi:MAG: hypothetical protein RLZZ214_2101 [Verrucomicrobiota bacterium]|jgi:hypothetical protein
MATPNYSFEKRRRELDKKAKKEEKRKLKLAAKEGGGDADAPETPEGDEPPAAEETPA